MMPDHVASTVPIAGLYYPPDDNVTTPIFDWELGGVALNDASQGLMVKNWKCWLQGLDIKLQPETGGAAITLFQQTDITELALAFDQNMRWSVAYIHGGVLKLRWYDSALATYVISVFSEARNPKMGLDDKRAQMISTSDMILAYIRGNGLYFRQQRDRFLIEYALSTTLFPNTKLKNIGMNKNRRMQFELV